MKLIAGGLNGNYLRDILLGAGDQVEWVKAAVAYASGSPELIDFCVDRNIPMEFWGRLDEGLPISTPILERFLRLGPNYTCKLVWKYFHPKIIWFGGYGVYIGSANLTSNAWYKNIECGVFYDHDEITHDGIALQLDEIFEGVNREAVPLTEELLNKIKGIEKKYERLDSRLAKAKAELESEFEAVIGKTISNPFKGLSVVNKQSAGERQKARFLAEWNDTLQLIRQISEKVTQDQFRPDWIKSTVPKGVQVDQFLHAYYYTSVKPGQKSSHPEFHEKNRSNPEKALKEAMQWWRGLEAAPSSESEMIYEYAPLLLDYLSVKKIRTLTQDDFLKVCQGINAFGTAARQCKNRVLGLPEKTQLQQPERVKVVSNWIFNQTAGNDSRITEVLYHVLYGGSIDDVSERLWQAAFTDEWHIAQFGLSCLGEIIGWAMPDKYPPRNGRTSKALFALGFNVKIYSE